MPRLQDHGESYEEYQLAREGGHRYPDSGFSAAFRRQPVNIRSLSVEVIYTSRSMMIVKERMKGMVSIEPPTDNSGKLRTLMILFVKSSILFIIAVHWFNVHWNERVFFLQI
jgi:hypothetical protein